MRKKRRFSDAQKIAIVKEIKTQLTNGQRLGQACKNVGVTVNTFRYWKTKWNTPTAPLSPFPTVKSVTPAVAPIPVRTEDVFAFYGKPTAVTRLVQNLGLIR